MKAVKIPTKSQNSGSAFFVNPNTDRVPIKMPKRESEKINSQLILPICGGKDNKSCVKASGFQSIGALSFIRKQMAGFLVNFTA
ncbi:MAG TPA: hypothetical protein VHD35_06515 [Chitinophagaceae bacterium]|nr:hypothetical protein [Chitinophagaceae bacterium]